jgi:hypothetical protein
MIDNGWLQIALAFSLAINIVLIFILHRAWKQSRPYPSSKCAKCGYDIRTTIEGICPECGEPVNPSLPLLGAVVRCGFCGKSNRDTGPQAMGPDGLFICARCVELCHNMILKNRTKKNKTTANKGEN